VRLPIPCAPPCESLGCPGQHRPMVRGRVSLTRQTAVLKERTREALGAPPWLASAPGGGATGRDGDQRRPGVRRLSSSRNHSTSWSQLGISRFTISHAGVASLRRAARFISRIPSSRAPRGAAATHSRFPGAARANRARCPPKNPTCVQEQRMLRPARDARIAAGWRCSPLGANRHALFPGRPEGAGPKADLRAAPP